MIISHFIRHASKFIMPKIIICVGIAMCCLCIVPAQALTDPLSEAAYDDDLAKVKSLLAHAKPSDSLNSSKNTALLTAAQYGHVSIVQYLLDEGADINARDASGFTPLYRAASQKDITTVRLLLKRGANVNSKDEDQATVLVYYPYDGIAEMLIEYGADVNAQNNVNMTPLIYATMERQHKTMQLLLAKGAKVNTLSDGFGSALIYAALIPHFTKEAKILIDGGADINLKGPRGNTALMAAATHKNSDLVQLLLVHGANPNIALDTGHTMPLPPTDKEHDGLFPVGSTALMIAVHGNNIDSVKALLQHKSTHVHAKNALGETAQSYAIQLDRKEIVELLKKAGTIQNKQQ